MAWLHPGHLTNDNGSIVLDGAVNILTIFNYTRAPISCVSFLAQHLLLSF